MEPSPSKFLITPTKKIGEHAMKKIIDFREDVEEKPGEMRLPRKKADETRPHRKKIRPPSLLITYVIFRPF